MKKQLKKGFTLVELLVVIAIIGMLSTLAVVALGSARSQARDARRISDIKQIQTALELYYSDAGIYPSVTPAATLGSGNFAVLCSDGFEDVTGDCTGAIFMGQVPANIATPVTTGYTYTDNSGDNSTYDIRFELENGTGGLPGGVVLRATPFGIEVAP